MPVGTRATRETESATSAWIAAANLSVSRPTPRNDKTGVPQAVVIHRGEELPSWVSDDVIQRFLHDHPVPVIRRKSEGPGGPVTARMLFGRRPRAEQFGAREDPPGSSKVTVNEDIPDPVDPRNAPEATDPTVDLSVDPDAAKDR
jgi:hypothetical protein